MEEEEEGEKEEEEDKQCISRCMYLPTSCRWGGCYVGVFIMPAHAPAGYRILAGDRVHVDVLSIHSCTLRYLRTPLPPSTSLI